MSRITDPMFKMSQFLLVNYFLKNPSNWLWWTLYSVSPFPFLYMCWSNGKGIVLILKVDIWWFTGAGYVGWWSSWIWKNKNLLLNVINNQQNAVQTRRPAKQETTRWCTMIKHWKQKLFSGYLNIIKFLTEKN